MLAYIGLGGNLGDSLTIFHQVIEDLNAHSEVQIQKVSSFYRTQPLDNADQPEYLNAVLSLETELSPHQLLDLLQGLENKYGRQRTDKRWDSRTLDLDILLYGEQRISDNRLQIPHRELAHRDFVIFPLYEIAPQLQIPGLGSLEDLQSRCENRGMKKL
ncbi:MAG: 2-amino-4-hydroxy-6-hydroxymethyldihydropteridine diphosphokinase [Gammaproteobacteria bacterium]|nr:2-amino-4-hydroxy-6-hydroxymethyldihydropteridine diphosphokinase [Gammaproteobacteria bacterium]